MCKCIHAGLATATSQEDLLTRAREQGYVFTMHQHSPHGLLLSLVQHVDVCMHVYADKMALFLVTRPSFVNLIDSIKCMGDSRSYFPHRSLSLCTLYVHPIHSHFQECKKKRSTCANTLFQNGLLTTSSSGYSNACSSGEGSGL